MTGRPPKGGHSVSPKLSKPHNNHLLYCAHMRDKKLLDRLPRLLKDLQIEQREWVDEQGELWLLVSPEDVEFLHGGMNWSD